MKKLAVVLFNLGGPDAPASVEPFLFNLFNDPAIISVPNPMRWLLAKLISRRRAPIAREIYEHLGGKSPLLALTEAQGRALEGALAETADQVRAFVCMRYWHPMTEETVAAVKDWAPDQVVLLPLYPQYSTTTSGSSLAAWNKVARRRGLSVPTRSVGCFPADGGLVAAQAARTRAAVADAARHGRPRVLFSAHGLPKKVIAAGDPYQWQVERTTAAVVAAMIAADPALSDLDWKISYQSRVGPLEWIGPATDDEIVQAGRDGVPLVVVPIAFVSEHSETLVELDIEYGALAAENGVPHYGRVPALNDDPAFVGGLAEVVRKALAADPEGAGAVVCGEGGGRVCPPDRTRCPCRAG